MFCCAHCARQWRNGRNGSDVKRWLLPQVVSTLAVATTSVDVNWRS
jgi:hypothetical protein